MLRISERYLIHGGLAHFFVAVARDGFGLLLVELGVAKFARVAYRNILDEVC